MAARRWERALHRLPRQLTGKLTRELAPKQKGNGLTFTAAALSRDGKTLVAVEGPSPNMKKDGGKEKRMFRPPPPREVKVKYGVGWVVVLNDEEDANWIGFVQNSAGAILSPFDSWLVLRGTKTLALRIEQHDRTGRAVAAFL